MAKVYLMNFASIGFLTAFSLGLSGCVNSPRPISIDDQDRIVEAQMALSPWRLDIPLDGRPIGILSVLFDGTRNDMQHIEKGGRQTVIANIRNGLEEGGKLSLPARYYPGVGTSGSRFHKIFDAALGLSTASIAERACEETIKDVRKLQEQDPDVDIRVVVSGFSRGAASARHFMNLVEQGCPSSKGSQPASHVHFYALLYDTVATGQRKHLQLGIPGSADQVVHFVSLDERRIFFKPVFDAHPDKRRIFTIPMPGVHSDVGVGYKHGIGLQYEAITASILYQMGLSSKDGVVLNVDHDMEGGNDSRWPLEMLLGIGPARSANDRNRSKFMVDAATMTKTRNEEWKHRETGMRLGGRVFRTDSSQHVRPAFEITSRNGAYAVTPIGPKYRNDFWTTSFLDPEIISGGRQSYLQYHFADGGLQRLSLPEEILEQISIQKCTRLEVGIVSRDNRVGIWWLVDGTIFGKVRNATISRPGYLDHFSEKSRK